MSPGKEMEVAVAEGKLQVMTLTMEVVPGREKRAGLAT